MLTGTVLAGVAMVLYGGYLVAYKRHYVGYPSLLYLGLVETSALGWYLVLSQVLGRTPVFVTPAGFGLEDAVGLAFVVGATVAAAVAGIWALQRGDVSYVAPLLRLAPPVVLAVEVGLLGVRISALQAVGLFAVTAGVYVLNWEGLEAGLFAPLARVARARPARLALGSAVLIGLADVGRRVMLADVRLAPQTLVAVTLVGLAVGTLPLGLRRWDARPRRLRAWLGIAGLGLALALADHATALALVTTPASVVVPIVSGQAVLAVVVGGEILDESAVARRTAAAVTTAAGVALVAVA